MVNKLPLPPTPNEIVGKINEIIDDKQDTLVSGTNIKTINNTSILGSGNIDIQGGGGGTTYTAGDGINIANDVISADIATSVSASSTNKQSVGAKLFYDTVGDIEAALHAINSGSNSVNLSWYGVDTWTNSITINNEIVVSDESVPSSETLIGSYSKGSEVVLVFAWERQVNTTYKLFINDTYITTATYPSQRIEYTFTLTEDTVIRLVAESSTPMPPTPSMPS